MVQQVTPDRRTSQRFDVEVKNLVEPVFYLTRTADEMCQGQDARGGTRKENGNREKVVLIPGEGWELKTLQTSLNYPHQRTEVAANNMLGSNGLMSLAGGVEEVKRFRDPTELINATSGAAAGYNSGGTGDVFLRNMVEQGADWSDVFYTLAADVAAFPFDTSNDDIPMLRIARGNSNHDPNQPLLFRFDLSATGVAAPAVIAKYGCAGAASSGVDWIGYGQYVVEFYGDGTAYLLERSKSTLEGGTVFWRPCKGFRYSEAHRTMASSHRVYIRPVTYRQPRGAVSGTILIQVESVEESPGGAFSYATGSPVQTSQLKYFVPVHPHNTPNRQAVPVRIEHARNIRPDMQAHIIQWETEAVLWDDSFDFDFVPYRNKPIILQWLGKIPAGCSISGRIYAHGTADELATIVGSGNFTDNTGAVIGGYRSYATEYGITSFRAVFTLTGPGTDTPILERISVQRDGTIDTVAPGEFSGGDLLRYSFTGADFDPSHETAHTAIADLKNELTTLSGRASIPTIIQTTLDPGDPTNYTINFWGWAETIFGRRKGSKQKKALGSNVDALYPHPEWQEFDIESIGDWLRIGTEAKVPIRPNFGFDPLGVAFGNGQGWKVTDIIRNYLSWSGKDSDEIDVPDLPLRISFRDSFDAIYPEPDSQVADLLMHLVRDYLGYWITKDANAVGSGMHERGAWRALPPNSPPYNNLLAFTTSGPGLANSSVAYLPSYGTTTAVSPKGNVQTIHPVFVRKGTLRRHPRRPYANIVTVVGASGLNANGEKLVQTAPNFRSYNFAGLAPGDPNYPDPTDPDYLPRIVGIKIYDPTATTEEKVNWLLRRYFDRLCHGAECFAFEGPLVYLTDVDDPKQVRPRMPRFYDPGTFNGTQILVRSCTPSTKKDGVQMAIYELETPGGQLDG
jgi:hypothetical protein